MTPDPSQFTQPAEACQREHAEVHGHENEHRPGTSAVLQRQQAHRDRRQRGVNQWMSRVREDADKAHACAAPRGEVLPAAVGDIVQPDASDKESHGEQPVREALVACFRELNREVGQIPLEIAHERRFHQHEREKVENRQHLCVVYALSQKHIHLYRLSMRGRELRTLHLFGCDG